MTYSPQNGAGAVKTFLPDYLSKLGCDPELRGEDKLTARCPLHDDRTPSLTASLKGDAWVWFCHPCAKGGTIIDLHADLHGINAAMAIRELRSKYFGGGSLRIPAPPKAKSAFPPPPPSFSSWPELTTGREGHLIALANLRKLPLDVMRRALGRGYLRFSFFRREHCYALTDGGKKFLQLRRLNGLPFERRGGNTYKSHNWPGSKCTPIGAHHLGDNHLGVLITEGAVGYLELLALLHLTVEQKDLEWAALAMTGASSSFSPDLLEKLRGRRVRIIGDVDNAGEDAIDRWTTQLHSVRADVERVNLRAVPLLDTLEKPDLGDLLKLPDSPEKLQTLYSIVSP